MPKAANFRLKPGFGIHSDQDEYVQIDAVPRRLYLVARMIMDLSQGL